ncbi:MAG: NTP transferase domain-containing protein [Lachnospiraceae bacterium]|nr:NTP transferase domain-containing protein [Lachnospiraceae bacterium]
MEYIVVQAGGKGTRLQYLTENKPKALVPIDNLPMLFHLFRKYPDKRFVIIADYKKAVMREYLDVFADVKYNIVDALGTGTCSGIKQAIDLIPDKEPFMLVWSDLILPTDLMLPEGYEDNTGDPSKDYVGLSQTFPCRWKYENGQFSEERSVECGVAGFFLFTDKAKIEDVPESGELVRWMQSKGKNYETVGLAGTREFGLLEEYEKLETAKCRPFNRITIDGDILIKESVDTQGEKLAKRECAWYEKAKDLGIGILPKIYTTDPLKMEYIQGRNIYECDLGYEQKLYILKSLVSSLDKLHEAEKVPADSFSVKEAYFNKTFDRLAKIQDLIPFGRDHYITVNGRKCRNVYYHKRELERALDKLVLTCKEFSFIHGDCTFSNMMVRESGEPVLIDPRGYFGYSELYGDVRYDWAKIYYSIAGNYDQFNLGRFRLHIGEDPETGVKLEIESNHWETLADEFIKMTGSNEQEIKLLHAVIWLSLTTYAWQDYDSICGAFYNGLYYLEDFVDDYLF